MAPRNRLLPLLVLLLGAGLIGWMLLGGPRDSPPAIAEATSERGASPGEDGSLAPTGSGETPGGDRAPGRSALRLVETGGEELRDDGSFEENALFGRVVDPEGEGVVGAEVAVTGERSEQLLAEGVTDDDGRFRFRGLTPFVPYRVFVTAEGFFPENESHQCGRDLALPLERAIAIEGRVLDAERSTPLAGVEVILDVTHVAEGELLEAHVAISAEDGAYQLPWGRVEGQQQLQARRPGHQSERIELQVHPERTRGYDIRLRIGYPLVLELYELETGTVLGGIEVEVDGRHRARADEAGRLDLSFLTSRRRQGGEHFSVSVTPDGWCQTRRWGKREEVERGGVLPIPLSRGARVHGRVTEAETGRSIAGARISLSGIAAAAPSPISVTSACHPRHGRSSPRARRSRREGERSGVERMASTRSMGSSPIRSRAASWRSTKPTERRR
jgi:hypothetical protein